MHIPIYNDQPIEKPEPEDVAVAGLDVHSIFSTLQGEGPFVGNPAVFVRLAGCNLQCPLCDTEYVAGRSRFSIPGIYDAILDLKTSYNPLIVITGGEPFRQKNLGEFCYFLIAKGMRVQIETNGTLYRGDLPWFSPDLTIVCAPKAAKVNPNLVPRINAWKYVVKLGDVDMDGLPIHVLDHTVAKRVARPPVGVSKQKIYVQPADEQDLNKNADNLQVAMRSVMQHGYTLCLQTHKILELP